MRLPYCVLTLLLSVVYTIPLPVSSVGLEADQLQGRANALEARSEPYKPSYLDAEVTDTLLEARSDPYKPPSDPYKPPLDAEVTDTLLEARSEPYKPGYLDKKAKEAVQAY
jgi:hypothetical protein